MVGIGDVLIPFATADAHRKLIRIEGRPADQGEHLSGVGVDGDHGAIAVAKSIFSSALDIEIDGETEALSGFSGLGAEAANLAAVAVDDDVFRSVFAAQDAIVGGFYAGAADNVAWLIHGVARVVEHFLAYLADVADQMSGESVAGIKAPLLLNGVEFGKLVLMRFDEFFFVGGDVLFKGQGLVFGSQSIFLQDGVDLVDGHVQTAGDQRQVGCDVVALLADEEAGDGGVVVDDESAFAIEDFAAGGEDGNFADAVGFSQGVVVLAADHLQAPQAKDQNGQDCRDHVLDNGEAEWRKFFVAVEHRSGRLHGPQRALKKGHPCMRKGDIRIARIRAGTAGVAF